VNLAGANFGRRYSDWPGRYGKDYVYPSDDELDYYRSKGLTLIRLPFSWERVQPMLFGPLDPFQVSRIRHFVNAAYARGMEVVLDSHDFGRYRPFDDTTAIGSRKVPIAAFQNYWTRMARQFAGVPGVYGYDIENEPHDMGSPQVWPKAAQAAVDGIRSIDRRTTVIVEGDGWSNAAHWLMYNDNLAVKDPSNLIVYSAHVYFDRNGTGRYAGSYDQERAYPNIGVDRLRPFVDWLHRRGFRGFVGEYGVPGNDPRWLVALRNFLQALRENALPGTYWAGGPWWGNDPLSVEPVHGRDRSQMSILERFPTLCDTSPRRSRYADIRGYTDASSETE
jgi:endoglucanase